VLGYHGKLIIQNFILAARAWRNAF